MSAPARQLTHTEPSDPAPTHGHRRIYALRHRWAAAVAASCLLAATASDAPAAEIRPAGDAPLAPSAAPLHGEEDAVAPRLVSEPHPRYPGEALGSGITGDVTVEVTVAPDGRVVAVDNPAGPGPFLAAAVDAAWDLIWEPGRRGGIPVTWTTRVTLHFEPPPGLGPEGADSQVVVITSQRPAARDTHARATLDREALEAQQGQDLAEAVSQVPGVAAARGTAEVSKPVVRGQYERRLLLLFDGVRHESQKWGLDHAPEIDPFTAGEITVVKGAAGVRYGPDAIGGVILVDPPPLRTEPGVGGTAQLVGVTNGLRGVAAARLDVVPARAPSLSWRVEGSASRGAAVSAPTYVLGNTGSAQWSAGSTLQLVRPSLAFKMLYQHYDLRSGVCWCANSETPSDFLAQLDLDAPIGSDAWKTSYPVDRPFQAVSHDLALARGLVDLPAWGDLEVTYSFQLNRRREYEQTRQSVTGPLYDFTLRTHALDATLVQDTRPVGEGASLDGGLGLSGTFQENVYQGLPLIPNYRALGGGVFAWEGLSRGQVEVEVGGRLDALSRTAYLTHAAFDRAIGRGTLAEEDCARTETAARCPAAWRAASASLGGSWTSADERFQLRMNLSSTSRFPDSDELYLSGSAPTFPVYAIGDPGLGVETVWGMSPTGSLRLPWLDVEVSTYVNAIQDYVYFAPELGPDGRPKITVLIQGAYPVYTFTPIDALFYGVDGGLTLFPDAPVSLKVQGSVVRGLDRATGEGLVLIPPDRGQASAQWRPPDVGRLRRPRLEVRAELVARQSHVDPADDLAPPPAGYALLGAGASASLSLKRRDLRLGVEGTNLLNTRYRDYMSLLRYYADEPGRVVRIRLGVEF